MKKRVLVFPCGSEIGLEIYNSLKNSLHFELIGLSSVADHGKFVYENYIEGIGFYTEFDFIIKLKKIIINYKIDIIYPTMDSVISYLKNFEDEIKIPVVGPSFKVAKICASKRETYKLLKNHIRVPTEYSKKNPNLQFPLFVKPNNGYGSRNAYIVENLNQIKNIDLDKNILCEYLPGQEYTVDCFSGLNGNLLFVGARERIRTNNGISVNTKTNSELTLEFRKIANKINEIIPFKGAWFFQLKRDINNEPCLLEIACRFAGSSSLHRIQGVNFALSNLFITIGIESDFIVNNFEVELDRALNSVYKIHLNYDTVFIDYDDTIICDHKINIDAIKFLYQCINLNKRLYLITKHKGNIFDDLKKFKINNIFTDILHIKENEQKKDFIKKVKFDSAIFIDDSFAERKKIFEDCKIPTFGVDCLDSLIN